MKNGNSAFAARFMKLVEERKKELADGTAEMDDLLDIDTKDAE